MNVQEEPIGSCQKNLDVMCFPILFPDEILIDVMIARKNVTQRVHQSTSGLVY